MYFHYLNIIFNEKRSMLRDMGTNLVTKQLKGLSTCCALFLYHI
jgi:hypothetical protein